MDTLEHEHELKGLVTHNIFAEPDSVTRKLLDLCVLSSYGSSVTINYSNRAKVKILQKDMQYQYLRVIKEFPSLALSLIYDANCCPCGYTVKPRTRVCNRPNVCAWCFTRRRLVPIYNTLISAGSEDCDLLIVKPGLVDLEKDCFFEGRRSPHYWFNAKVSVQLKYPEYRFNSFPYNFVNFSVIKKDIDVGKKFAEVYGPTLQFAVLPFNEANILKGISSVIQPYFYNLYLPTNISRFMKQLSLVGPAYYRTSRNLRINRKSQWKS